MERPLYSYRYVHGSPALLEDRLLEGAVERLSAGPPLGDGSLLLDLPTDLVGVRLEKQVRLRTGACRHVGRRAVLPLEWRAQPGAPAFPSFEGSVELWPLAADRAQLTVAGTYRPPLGVVGAVIDAVALHTAAQRTADWLLDRLAERLAEEGGEPTASHGRADSLRVGDVLTRSPLTLDPDLPLKTAALMLFHGEVSGAPVVAVDGTLVGVLSERDLLAKEATRRWALGRKAARELDQAEARTVREACSAPARTTVPDARLADAAREMLDHDVGRLVVLDEGRVAGIVSRHDVLAALIRDDAVVHAAILDRLSRYPESDVRASVEWGEVTLTGTTELRSQAEAVVGAARGVEGVSVVEASELGWRYDDVVPGVPLPYG